MAATPDMCGSSDFSRAKIYLTPQAASRQRDPITPRRFDLKSGCGTFSLRTASALVMTHPRVALLFFVTAVMGGCRIGPGIEYRHLTDAELVQQSPIIVLGTLDRLETFWEERVRYGSENGSPMDWFHVQVHVQIESVLKGDVSTSALDYSYWIPVGPKVGEWNNPREGGRYIHFLRRHGRRFRSVVDFWPSTLRVTTGRHWALPQDNRLPEQIAHLLLIPGDGFLADHFDLTSAYVHARGLVGLSATLAMVQPFAKDPNPYVRKAACDMLRDGGHVLKDGGKLVSNTPCLK